MGPCKSKPKPIIKESSLAINKPEVRDNPPPQKQKEPSNIESSIQKSARNPLMNSSIVSSHMLNSQKKDPIMNASSPPQIKNSKQMPLVIFNENVEDYEEGLGKMKLSANFQLEGILGVQGASSLKKKQYGEEFDMEQIPEIHTNSKGCSVINIEYDRQISSEKDLLEDLPRVILILEKFGYRDIVQVHPNERENQLFGLLLMARRDGLYLLLKFQVCAHNTFIEDLDISSIRPKYSLGALSTGLKYGEDLCPMGLEITNKYILKTTANSPLILIEMELADNDLECMIKQRQNAKEPFQKATLRKIINDLVDLIFYLHMKQISVNVINPAKVYYNSQADRYFLMDTGNFSALGKLSTFFNQIITPVPQSEFRMLNYYSPVFKDLRFRRSKCENCNVKNKEICKRHDRVQHNPFKSDIFSFGMLLLDAFMAGKNQQNDFKTMFANVDTAEKWVKAVKEHSVPTHEEFVLYQEYICEPVFPLHSLLEFNEKARADILDVALKIDHPCLLHAVLVNPFKMRKIKGKKVNSFTYSTFLYEGPLTNIAQRDGPEGILKNSITDAVIYEGPWEEDLPNGSGKLFFSPELNIYYQGNFLLGKLHGKGKIVCGEVVKVQGEWIMNQQSSIYSEPKKPLEQLIFSKPSGIFTFIQEQNKSAIKAYHESYSLEEELHLDFIEVQNKQSLKDILMPVLKFLVEQEVPLLFSLTAKQSFHPPHNIREPHFPHILMKLENSFRAADKDRKLYLYLSPSISDLSSLLAELNVSLARLNMNEGDVPGGSKLLKEIIKNNMNDQTTCLSINNKTANEEVLGELTEIPPFERLVELNFERCPNLTDSLFESLSKSESLKLIIKSIRLRDTNLGDNTIQNLGNFAEIQELTLSMNNQLSSAGLELLPYQPCLQTLQKLDLSYSQFTDSHVQTISLTEIVNLNIFDLTGCQLITDESILIITSSTNFKKLRTLKINNCKLTNMSLEHLAKSETISLEELQVQHLPQINDKGVGTLVATNKFSLKNLKRLYTGFNALSDKSLKYISQSNMSQLELLDISWCDNITYQGIMSICESEILNNIKSLSLSYNKDNIIDQSLTYLANSPYFFNLETLDLAFCTRISDEGMKLYIDSSNASNLRDLNLRGTRITDAFFKALENSLNGNKLTSLDVSYCQGVTDYGLKLLCQEKFYCLERLDLRNMNNITCESINLLLQKPLSNLKEILVGNNQLIEESSRNYQSSLVKMRVLGSHNEAFKMFSMSADFDDSFFSESYFLSDHFLTNIVNLDLSSTHISDSSIEILVNHDVSKNILRLSLLNTRISNLALYKMAGSSFLINLISLDISFCEVSDQGFEVLKLGSSRNFQNLEILICKGLQLTDKALTLISCSNQLTRLRVMILDECQLISADGLKALSDSKFLVSLREISAQNTRVFNSNEDKIKKILQNTQCIKLAI